jgi:hypothetical protein
MQSMVEAEVVRNGHCGYEKNGGFVVVETVNWRRGRAVPRTLTASCNLLERSVSVV